MNRTLARIVITALLSASATTVYAMETNPTLFHGLVKIASTTDLLAQQHTGNTDQSAAAALIERTPAQLESLQQDKVRPPLFPETWTLKNIAIVTSGFMLSSTLLSLGYCKATQCESTEEFANASAVAILVSSFVLCLKKFKDNCAKHNFGPNPRDFSAMYRRNLA